MKNVNVKIVNRIKEIIKARGWSINHLAIEADISPSTILNWFNRKATPSINGLASICDTLGITLSEFFNESTTPIELSQQQIELLNQWDLLHQKEKETLLSFLKARNDILANCKPL